MAVNLMATYNYSTFDLTNLILDSISGFDVFDSGFSNVTGTSGANFFDLTGILSYVQSTTFLLDAGADSFEGSDVAETVHGEADNDTLNGNGGNDTLDGDSGDDVLNGGAGNDSFNGGSGFDFVDFSSSSENLSVNLNFAGVQAVSANEGNDMFIDIEGIASSKV